MDEYKINKFFLLLEIESNNNNFEKLEQLKSFKINDLHFNKEPGYIINLIGVCYFYGIIYPKNYSKALSFFKLGCKLNNSNSYNSIGVMYHKGILFKKSYYKAIKYYEKAIQLNNHNAMFNIAIVYRNIFDYDNFIFYLYRSIDYHNPEAYLKLSHCYENGLCKLPVDKLKSFDLLLKAVKYKSNSAIIKLAKMYEDGIYIDRDLLTANELYESIDKKEELTPTFFNFSI